MKMVEKKLPPPGVKLEFIAKGTPEMFRTLIEKLGACWLIHCAPLYLDPSESFVHRASATWLVRHRYDHGPHYEHGFGIIEAHQMPDEKLRIVFNQAKFPDPELFWGEIGGGFAKMKWWGPVDDNEAIKRMKQETMEEIDRLRPVPRLEEPQTDSGTAAEQATPTGDEAGKMGIFFAYAREDEDLRDELEKHLSMLKREGVITSWHDRKIGAGKEWEGEIDTHLNTARVILLLISSDFIDSDYCWDVEVKRAMERHEVGEARVIPVILRKVDWKSAPFGKLQALPTDAKPLTSWSNRDEAFFDVAQGIRVAVMELRAEDNDSDPKS